MHGSSTCKRESANCKGESKVAFRPVPWKKLIRVTNQKGGVYSCDLFSDERDLHYTSTHGITWTAL